MNDIATALHSLLAHNIVSFTYRKVNGEIRHAIGTRNLTLAEIHTCTTIPTPKGAEQPNSYYDVEVVGWRSYKPENLISIDGVYARNEPPTKKGELPKREIPISKPMGNGGMDIDNLGGLLVAPPDGFSGLCGTHKDDIRKEIRKAMDKLDKDIVIGAPAHSPKIGTPTATEKGIEFPLGDVSVDAFAKLVAHYVVEEIVNRLK